MMSLPICMLYSQDQQLSTRMLGFISRQAKFRPIHDPKTFRKLIRQIAPGVVLIDARGKNSDEYISYLVEEREEILVVVLGDPTSEALRRAEQAGVYAVENIEGDRVHFQSLIHRAFKRVELQQEVLSLREKLRDDTGTRRSTPPPRSGHRSRQSSMAILSRSLRYMDNVSALLDSAVDALSSAALVSRVGIFLRGREEQYRLASGVRCLPESMNLVYEDEDPLTQWLESQACQVVRGNLEHIPDLADRLMLQQELDMLGGEIIIPLLGRNQMLGWILLGNRATGIPFSQDDLEDFMVLADHISVSLENAHLYEEVAIQKTMAETLLHSIQTGICAINMDRKVTGINRSAEDILGVTHQQVFLENASVLGSRLADILLKGMEDGPQGPLEWTDPNTQKILEVESRALEHDGKRSGAVALLRDVTQKKTLQEKQDQVERALFWNDLAASMSHEIRNPLVAIKTFAQLLPDRYGDAEFRTEFSELVTAEVDRLNGIIEQIDGFAHPAELDFTKLHLPDVILAGVKAATDGETDDGTEIHTTFDPNLPKVCGDRNALSECFRHLVRNALEAVSQEKKGRIQITAQRKQMRNRPDRVIVTIEDNGPGVKEEIQHKLFSPFCTIKAAGMGLGLPIAKRTLIDHSGEIHVESGRPGTRVLIELPGWERSAQP